MSNLPVVSQLSAVDLRFEPRTLPQGASLALGHWQAVVGTSLDPKPASHVLELTQFGRHPEEAKYYTAWC